MRTLEDEAERARALVAKALPRIKRPDVLEYATNYLVTGTGVWPSPDFEHWTNLDSIVRDIVYYLSNDPNVFETEGYCRVGESYHKRFSDLDQLEVLLSSEPT
jgi:hypothetical protein